MPDKPPPDAAMLGVFFRIEMAADLAAIMPKRMLPELSRRSSRFNCGWRTKCAVLATKRLACPNSVRAHPGRLGGAQSQARCKSRWNRDF